MIGTDKAPPILLRDERISVDTDFDPVSINAVRDYLNVAHTEDDVLIKGLISSAVGIFEDRTSHYLKDQTRRVGFDRYATRYRIPAMPVRSLTAVETVDDSTVTMETLSEWYLEETAPKEIAATDSADVSSGFDVIRFEYTAGYASATNVPRDVQIVLKKMISDMYEYRTSEGEGLNRTLDEQPMQWEDLITPLQVPYYSQPKATRDSFFL